MVHCYEKDSFYYADSLIPSPCTSTQCMSPLWTPTLSKLTVPDPSKGVCADPVNRGAILEGGGPGLPGGNKERQLSTGKGRGKK